MRCGDTYLRQRLGMPMCKEAAPICAGLIESLKYLWWVCSLFMPQGLKTWLLSPEPSCPHLSLFAGRKQPLPALVAAPLRLIQWRLHRPRRSA